MPWPTSTAVNLFLLVILSALLFRKVFLHPDQMLWGNDIERVFSTYAFNQHQAFSVEGRFPLWDSTLMGGFSVVGNPTQIALSPLVWLFRFSNSPLMFGLYFWIWATLSAWGTYLWLRLLKIQPAGCFLAALSFAFSAKTAGHMFGGHVDVLATMLCAPWCFWAAERVLQRQSIGSAIVLSLVITVSATSGHIPTLYWNIAFAALYVAFRAIPMIIEGGWNAAKRPTLMFTVAGLVFVVGAAGWWLPIARQILNLSARSHESTGYGFATMFSAEPSDLLRMLWPFHGRPLPRPFVSDPENTFFWETASYPGLVALVLAAYAVIATPKRATTRIFAGLAALALLLALGSNTPVHRIFYEMVPGVALMRAPGRILAYSNLFLSCLAGIGLAEILSPTAARRWVILLLSVTLLLVTAAIEVPFSAPSESAVGKGTLALGVLTALLSVVLIRGRLCRAPRAVVIGILGIAIVDLGFVWNVHMFTANPNDVFASNSVAEFLEARRRTGPPFRYYDPTRTVPQQLAARHGLESITGYEAGLCRHQIDMYKALWKPGEQSGLLQLFMHSPKEISCTGMLDLANTRYVVAYEPELDDRFRRVFSSPPGEFARPRHVYERSDPLQRAFVVPTGLPANEEARVPWQDICEEDIRTVCFLEGGSVEGGAAFQEVVPTEWHPGALQLDFETKRAGVLFLSEGWHPDWVATDFGEPVEVRRANHSFIAVPIEEGSHSIRVWYRPWDFYLGCGVSAACWLAVGFIVVKDRRKRLSGGAGRGEGEAAAGDQPSPA